MTTNPTGQPTRVCVVADLEPDALMADLQRLEELLLTLNTWAEEAAQPDGDGWTAPGPLAGGAALAAINRLQKALRPTQTHYQRDYTTGDGHDVPPAGPEWYAADGRYQLAAISFVEVPAADVALLGEVAAELGRPDGDYEVRAAIDQHEEDLPRTGAARERERRGLVVTAARIAGLLDLEPTADTALLQAARADAGVDAERVVLTAEQEAAYHRTVDRITAMATLGDPLTRWAMGTRDRT
jgi:hypothetical protein